MNDEVFAIPASNEAPDNRYSYVEAVNKWITHEDERLWDDRDAMMAHLNKQEVEERVTEYRAHLAAVAKSRLSRPARKSSKIKVGKYKGQMSKALPAYTPDARAIEAWIKRKETEVREYLHWTLS